MVVTPLEVIGAIAALTSILNNLIIIVNGLHKVSAQCATILQQLRTLSSVLLHVDQEFNRTLKLIAIGSCNIGIDVTRDLLQQCIRDCTATCQQYELLLTKVSCSKFKPFRWKLSTGDLNRLHLDLEARKSTLLTVLTSIRQTGNNYQFAASGSQINLSHHGSCSLAPPSYDAAVQASNHATRTPADETSAQKVGFIAGGAAGAVSGAAVGAFAGPVGIALGGMFGGVIGGIWGLAVGEGMAGSGSGGGSNNKATPILKPACKMQNMDCASKNYGASKAKKLARKVAFDERICDGSGYQTANCRRFVGSGAAWSYHQACRTKA